MSLRARRSGWRYRGNVAARAAAGSVGAYVVAALAAFAVARACPLDPLQATLVGTMLAFLVMPAAALWAFLAASPTRAWLVLALLAAALWGIRSALGPHP